ALVTLVLIFSVIVSALTEFIYNQLLNSRGKSLYKALSDVLRHKSGAHKDYTRLLYDHPIINTLKPKPNRLPSYIPGLQFASALVEVIVTEEKGTRFVHDTTTGKTGIYTPPESLSTYAHLRNALSRLDPFQQDQ